MAHNPTLTQSGIDRRHFLAGAVALGGGILAACTPTQTAGPSSAGAPGGTGSTNEPIKIGASVSTTGSNGKTGEYQYRAYLLWEEQITARGGLLGRQVKFTILDDQSDPATGARLYEKLISEDKMDLVLGPYASNVTQAVSQVTEKYKYPMIACGASASDIWSRNFRYVFGVYSVAEDYFKGLIDLGVKAGYKTVAVIYEDTTFPVANGRGTVAEAKAKGLNVVLEEKYPAKATDVSSVIAKIKALNPDMVLGGSYLPDSVLISRQAKEADLNAKLWGFSVGTAQPDYGQNLGKDANFIFGPSMWEPELPTKDNKAFFDAYMKKWNAEPDYHSATGYAGAQVLEAAVKQVGSLDREKLRDALAKLQMETVLPGMYKVNDTGVCIGHEPVTVQWQNGKRVIVGPDKFATGKAILPDPGWKGRT